MVLFPTYYLMYFIISGTSPQVLHLLSSSEFQKQFSFSASNRAISKYFSKKRITYQEEYDDNGNNIFNNTFTIEKTYFLHRHKLQNILRKKSFRIRFKIWLHNENRIRTKVKLFLQFHFPWVNLCMVVKINRIFRALFILTTCYHALDLINKVLVYKIVLRPF